MIFGNNLNTNKETFGRLSGLTCMKKYYVLETKNSSESELKTNCGTKLI
jgi:hypothetical protein